MVGYNAFIRVRSADLACCVRGYGNEKEVGEGIRASGVPRSEIFVRRRFHFPNQLSA